MPANEYKGHQIDTSGIRTMSDKIYAVVKAPPPPPPNMGTSLRFQPVVISLANDAAYFLTLAIYIQLHWECAEGYSLG